ncbi:MAG: endolytic transglycosylase MltG [Woeseiaceae bacterium]
MKPSPRVLISLLVAAILAGVLSLWHVDRVLGSPLNVPDGGMLFEIPPGSALTRVVDDLAEKDILTNPRIFRWYAQFKGSAASIRAGEYNIDAGTTPRELLDKFVSGDVQLYSFTVIEGWTYRELIQALSDHPAVEQGISFEDWPRLLESFEASAKHPEGLFLPETYRFPKNTKAVEILRQAFELMQDTLDAEWAGRDERLPLKSSYEALILASIIEKETARADERAKISGVFVRRLQKGMRLQTDPTVIYGIGESFDGNLTRRDLQTDTPYNTYTRAGLPPTPIALPGAAAINAALHPAAGRELYFVATGLGDGSHRFSETKEQHDAAVREFLARQRAATKRGK